MISGMTFGIFSEENLLKAFDFVVEKVKYMFYHPIETIERVFNEFMEYIEMPSVDITGEVNKFVLKVSDWFDGILNTITNFKDSIVNTVKDKFSGALSFFGIGDDDDKELKKSVGNKSINSYKSDKLFNDTVETDMENNKVASQYRDIAYTSPKERSGSQNNNTNVTSVVNNNIQQNNRDTSTGFNRPAVSLF